MTRRDLFTAALLLAPARGLAANAAPEIRFPSAPRDRLAVASYPFRAFIDTPRTRANNPQGPLMELKQFVAMVPARFEVHNVELLGEHFRSTDAAYLGELREASKAAGVRIVNVPTGVGASVYDTDPERRATALENAKKWIDAAATLECPSVRVHIQRAKGVDPDVARTVETLTAVARYGAEKGVVVNLENDDLVTEDAFFLVKVIDQVKSPWLRALPDFCNSMLGGNEKFNYDAVAAMFQRAYNISHVKDSEVEREKLFRVDLARTFAIAKSTHYRGYFSMEFEGAGDPYEGTRKLIEESLRLLAG